MRRTTEIVATIPNREQMKLTIDAEHTAARVMVQIEDALAVDVMSLTVQAQVNQRADFAPVRLEDKVLMPYEKVPGPVAVTLGDRIMVRVAMPGGRVERVKCLADCRVANLKRDILDNFYSSSLTEQNVALLYEGDALADDRPVPAGLLHFVNLREGLCVRVRFPCQKPVTAQLTATGTVQHLIDWVGQQSKDRRLQLKFGGTVVDSGTLLCSLVYEQPREFFQVVPLYGKVELQVAESRFQILMKLNSQTQEIKDELRRHFEFEGTFCLYFGGVLLERADDVVNYSLYWKTPPLVVRPDGMTRLLVVLREDGRRENIVHRLSLSARVSDLVVALNGSRRGRYEFFTDDGPTFVDETQPLSERILGSGQVFFRFFPPQPIPPPVIF
jgi:hypothetical protein